MAHQHTQACTDRRGFKTCGQTGEEWVSDRGLRMVVGQLDGKFLVSTEDSTSFELIEPSWLPRQIKIDESNAASSKKWAAVKEAEKAAEAARLDTKRGLHGFTAGMPAVKARKIEEALDKQQGFAGRFMPRREFIEQEVAAGSHVVTMPSGARRFMLHGTSGAFFLEKDITKTAMDYAEFLKKRKGGS